MLEAVRANSGRATVRGIAQATGFGITRVELSLARLEQHGKIRRSSEATGPSTSRRRHRLLFAAVDDFRSDREVAFSIAAVLAWLPTPSSAGRPVGRAIAAFIAAIALPLGALPVGAMTNGSFENGHYVDGGSGFETLAAGTANAGDITSWTVTSGTVDWVSAYWTSEDGSKSLELNGAPTADVPSVVGAISQNLATTVNNTYVVQFFLSGNPTCGPSTKTLFVSATGTATQSYYYTNTTTTANSDMGWMPETYSFAAKGVRAKLTFAADPKDPSDCGPALDDISIQ